MFCLLDCFLFLFFISFLFYFFFLFICYLHFQFFNIVLSFSVYNNTDKVIYSRSIIWNWFRMIPWTLAVCWCNPVLWFSCFTYSAISEGTNSVNTEKIDCQIPFYSGNFEKKKTKMQCCHPVSKDKNLCLLPSNVFA